MKTNDIYTAYVSWPGGGKRRPVIILQDSEDKVDVLRTTTKYKNKSIKIQRNYYPMCDWQNEGLNKQSYIDTGAIQSLLKKENLSFSYIGSLTTNEKKNLALFIRNKYRNK